MTRRPTRLNMPAACGTAAAAFWRRSALVAAVSGVLIAAGTLRAEPAPPHLDIVSAPASAAASPADAGEYADAGDDVTTELPAQPPATESNAGEATPSLEAQQPDAPPAGDGNDGIPPVEPTPAAPTDAAPTEPVTAEARPTTMPT